MAEIMGYPMGVCPTHGPKLAVNGTPTCIKCKAKEDNAGRVMQMVTVEDPGEDYFKGGKVNPQVKEQKLATKAGSITFEADTHTLDSGLKAILDILQKLPMPTSMKQYKLLMTVKQKIESALQEGQNG